MEEKVIETMNEKNTEEVHEKNSPKEYVRRLREQGLCAPLNNNRHIMDFEEKRYTVGYVLSKRKTNDRFNVRNIRKQWLSWWRDDFVNLSNECIENVQKELQKQYIPNRSKKENQELYKKRMFHLRDKHFKELIALLQKKELADKYYIYNKTLSSRHPLRLGKYAIYEKGQSKDEITPYFGTYEEVKNMIEELAQQE